MWNSKASVTIYGIMLALTIIVLALALAPVIKQSTDSARNNVTGMDCDNSSISDFQKAGCLATDLNLFYFIGGVLFLAGAIISARIIFS